MARVYDTADFRALPRERCAVFELIGGECAGPICRHHVHPIAHDGPAEGRTVEVCAVHHPMVEALARRVYGLRPFRRCTHRHVTPEARALCEARLNRQAA